MSNLLTGARGGRFWMGGKRIVASYNDPSQILEIRVRSGLKEPRLPDSAHIEVDDPTDVADVIRELISQK
jgi:hypothetical protein